MIVEHFKNNDPAPVYRRFRERGRLAPEGLQYVSSWVDEKLERCFQLMEAPDNTYLNEWIANWSDIIDAVRRYEAPETSRQDMSSTGPRNILKNLVCVTAIPETPLTRRSEPQIFTD